MPAKLDRCVKHLKDQGKDNNAAYAICSKSTGWKKSGAHTWRKEKKKKPVSEGAFRKIGTLLQESQDLSDFSNGVYASVTLDPTNLQKIWTHLKKVGLPLMPIDQAHITVIYSKSKPKHAPQAWDINGSVEPIGFGIFGKGTRDQPYVLVLRVKSNDLNAAHKKWRSEYNLKPTYNEYKPHISLTFDIGRIFPKMGHLTERQKETITNIFDRLIPELPRRINIMKHTVENLNPPKRK